MLASSSLRGMRERLLSTFSSLKELHLHGGVNESFVDTSDDENVFEIAQAVAIHLYSRLHGEGAEFVGYGELRGARAYKYEILEQHRQTMGWQSIYPDDKVLTFGQQDDNAMPEMMTLDPVFGQYGAGVKTNQDAVAIAFNLAELRKSIWEFDKHLWIRSNVDKFVKKIHYRPFDIRTIFLHEQVVASRSLPTFIHMFDGDNIGLFGSSSWTSPQRFSVGVSRMIIEMKTGTHDRGTTFFPLYLRSESRDQQGDRRHNFSPTFIREWSYATSLGIEDGPDS